MRVSNRIHLRSCLGISKSEVTYVLWLQLFQDLGAFLALFHLNSDSFSACLWARTSLRLLPTFISLLLSAPFSLLRDSSSKIQCLIHSSISSVSKAEADGERLLTYWLPELAMSVSEVPNSEEYSDSHSNSREAEQFKKTETHHSLVKWPWAIF